MWIEDLTKALWMLNSRDIKWACCVWKIEDGYIYMTYHGLRFKVSDLVAEYDKEYGVSNS